jgi:hypothetical protein
MSKPAASSSTGGYQTANGNRDRSHNVQPASTFHGIAQARTAAVVTGRR